MAYIGTKPTTALLQSSDIADNAITSAKIADNQILTSKLADNAVTEAKVADDAVTSAQIADDAVTSALIADDAVTSAQIADDAVTSALIADDAVLASHMSSFPAGHVIQTQGAYCNANFTFDPDGSWVELHTDLRVTIQSASTNNKFLIHASIQSNSPNQNQIWSWLIHNVTTSSTVAPYGISNGSRVRQHFSSRPVAYDSNDPENLQYTLWADIPDTNSNTYTIYGRNADGGGPMYVNYSNSNSSAWQFTAVSSLIIQEIQQ